LKSERMKQRYLLMGVREFAQMPVSADSGDIR
jgi:hypothetical protein